MVQPRRLLLQQVDLLLSHMPGVWEGQPESIHDARVAIRRIRVLLPLAPGWGQWSNAELGNRFKRAGRALGRVREVDVHVELLSSLERRVPTSASAIVQVRRHFEEHRRAVARRLVKRLESLELSSVLAQLAANKSSLAEAGSMPRHSWRRNLRAVVLNRAGVARDAIAHATGTYMPNRIHAVRIAVKQLRYALEASEATGMKQRTHELRRLRRAQEILGDLHDRETLMDAMEALSLPPGEVTDQVNVVIGVVGAECRELHERYLARRAAVVQICEDARRSAEPARLGKALALGVLGASLGLGARQLVVVGRRASAYRPDPPASR
jgi:CHAD domain-containing protein